MTRIPAPLTPAQAALLAGFGSLAAGALTDADKLRRWAAGREAFDRWSAAGRYGETRGARLYGGESGQGCDVSLTWEQLDAARAHLEAAAPDVVRQLHDARIDHLLTLAPIVTRTATPADRAAEAAARGVLEHWLHVALAHLTPAGPTVARRRVPPQVDPAEIELEHAAYRRELDAAIVADQLTGDVELFELEAPAPAPSPARPARRRRPAPVASGAFRQLAIDPASADEDGAQLDVFAAVAAAELELAGGPA